jgi:hypothetical protein
MDRSRAAPEVARIAFQPDFRNEGKWPKNPGLQAETRLAEEGGERPQRRPLVDLYAK